MTTCVSISVLSQDHLQVPPTLVSLSGHCQQAFNGIYLLIGNTPHGAPVYSKSPNDVLFYDSDCDGKGSKPGWFLSVGAVELDRSSDLDVDGDCASSAYIWMETATLPFGLMGWSAVCDQMRIPTMIEITEFKALLPSNVSLCFT